MINSLVLVIVLHRYSRHRASIFCVGAAPYKELAVYERKNSMLKGLIVLNPEAVQNPAA